MSVVGEGGLAKSTLFITEIVTNLAKDILSIVKKIGQVLKKYCMNAHYAANPSWPFSPIKELKLRHNIVWLGVW